MQEEDKVVPITRGKRSRLQLNVTSGICSISVRLQPMEPNLIRSTAHSGPASQPNVPGKLLEFEPQKGKPNMNRYAIADDNRVHAVEGTADGGTVFASEQDLQQLTAGWPLRRLVEIWNQLPGVTPVARFENRTVGARRIWQALQAPKMDGPARQGARGAKGRRPRSWRESKLQLVLKLLRTPAGATLQALMKVTRWQAHSVRGFLSAKVSKHLGLPLESFRRDGERVYRLPAEQ